MYLYVFVRHADEWYFSNIWTRRFRANRDKTAVKYERDEKWEKHFDVEQIQRVNTEKKIHKRWQGEVA